MRVRPGSSLVAAAALVTTGAVIGGWSLPLTLIVIPGVWLAWRLAAGLSRR